MLVILSCLNYPLAVNEVPFSTEIFLRCYLAIFCTSLHLVSKLYSESIPIEFMFAGGVYVFSCQPLSDVNILDIDLL